MREPSPASHQLLPPRHRAGTALINLESCHRRFPVSRTACSAGNRDAVEARGMGLVEATGGGAAIHGAGCWKGTKSLRDRWRSKTNEQPLFNLLEGGVRRPTWRGPVCKQARALAACCPFAHLGAMCNRLRIRAGSPLPRLLCQHRICPILRSGDRRGRKLRAHNCSELQNKSVLRPLLEPAITTRN